MSKEDFLETQKQFLHAVIGFANPLSLIAARMPDVSLRMRIVKTVCEEHGEGNLNESHGVTFNEFMKRLNDGQEVSATETKLAVTLFNTTLNGICINQPYLVGVAALGMIERMFADISAFIGMTVVERG